MHGFILLLPIVVGPPAPCVKLQRITSGNWRVIKMAFMQLCTDDWCHSQLLPLEQLSPVASVVEDSLECMCTALS